MKNAVPVVDARLAARRVLGMHRRKMEFPRKSARVSMIGQHARDQNFIARNLLPVLTGTSRMRITASEKRSPARRANGILTEGVVELNSAPRERVEIGSADKWIAIAAERVPTLLIGADPENVRPRSRRHSRRM